LCSLFCTLALFFFSSRRRHTRSKRDWSSDVCSSDLSVVILDLSPNFLLYVSVPLEVISVFSVIISVFSVLSILSVLSVLSVLFEIGRASCRDRVYTSLFSGSLVIYMSV